MTRTSQTLFVLLILGLALTACGDDTSLAPDAGDAPDASGDGDGYGDGGDGDGDAGISDEYLAPTDDGWLTLITGDWEIAPGDETYRCVRFTVPEDIYINAMKPLIPFGTHHTVLTIGEPDAPDGIEVCDVSTNHGRQIGGSGVGTDPQHMPDGVAVHVEAGQQLLLNLHLFNATEEPLHGKSGTLIQTTDEADVEHIAEAVLAGTISLTIPPGETTTQTGRCTFTEPATIFAVLPHMHQLGVHMKVTAETAADGDHVLFDGPYDFEQQDQHDIDMLELEAGDTIKVDCTYTSDREEVVNFGDSSLAEMCFAGLLRFPASATDGFTCVN